MSESDKSVFISYRRKHGAGWARAILQDLKAHGYDVFVDVESIDSGSFESVILNQIEARAHFLLLLTPGCLDRCNEAEDWLRREIQHAIKLQRNVVPLTLEQFSFATHAGNLPAALAPLTKYNALAIYHDYFDQGMDKLRDRFLKQPVVGAIKPTPKADRPRFLELLNASNREIGAFDPKLKPIDWLTLGSDLAKKSAAPSSLPEVKKPEKSQSFDWQKLLPTDDPNESRFPFLKRDKAASPWPFPIGGTAAAADHLKPGDFQLNAAGIPTAMLDKLTELLAAGETIKQIAFGPKGSWVFIRNRCSFWKHDVPEEMTKQLWEQFNNNKGIAHVALAPNGGWVILQERVHLMFKNHDIPSSLYEKLLDLYSDDKEIKCVAFSPKDGWVVLYGKNGFWCENVPGELLQKMHEWADLHYELKQVALGSNASWVLLAGTTGYWQQNIPKKMADKLGEYHAAGKTIKSVAISPDSGWVILGD
jgi:TIR domain